MEAKYKVVMKNIFSFMVLLLISTNLFSWGQSSKSKIPILIPTSDNGEWPKVTIPTNCIYDTTVINVSFGIRFKYKLSDSFKQNSPQKIYFIDFGYRDSNKRKKEFPVIDSCIRQVCESQFKIWLNYQPYSDMFGIERFYGYDGFALYYTVYLIPKKPIKR